MKSSPTYKIRDWAAHFENHESRKIKCLQWVPVKNKHDGSGYRRVASLPCSVEVFCAWSLIVQVASRMPERGVLRDDDGPLTATELSWKTGFPEQIFVKAFEVLADSKIRWLEVIDGEISRRVPESPGTSGNFGVEGKGIEVSAPADTSDPSDLVSPSTGATGYPTLEQALKYAKGAPVVITPEQTTAWHESRSDNGWQTSVRGTLTPIADWRSNLHSFVRIWNAKEADKRAKQEERQRKAAEKEAMKQAGKKPARGVDPVQHKSHPSPPPPPREEEEPYEMHRIVEHDAKLQEMDREWEATPHDADELPPSQRPENRLYK